MKILKLLVLSLMFSFISLLGENGTAEVILENPFLKIMVTEQGGKISSFYDKTKGKELVRIGNSQWDGFCKDRIKEYNGEIIKENYSLEKKETDNQIIVKARFSASSGKLKDLQIEKTYTLPKDKRFLRIDYSIKSSIKREPISLWVHNFLPFGITNLKGYFFQKEGKIGISKKGGDVYIFEPGNSWFGVIDKEGEGIIAILEKEKISYYYYWLAGNDATFEWVYNPIDFDHNKNWQTTYFLSPIDTKIGEVNNDLPDLKEVYHALASIEKEGGSLKITKGPQSFIKPLITTTPTLPPGRSGFLFTDNIQHIAYVSSDMPTMISFKCINPEHKPYLFLEIPEEIKLLSGMRNISFLNVEKTERQGRSYNRYKILVGDPAGWIRLFWSTTLNPGEKFKGYYWAEWDKGRQKEQELPIETINIKKIRPPKKLFIYLSIPSDLAAEWPDYNDFCSLGFNTLDFWPYTRNGSLWGMSLLETILTKTKDKNITLAAWPGEWWWPEAQKNDPDAQAVLITGEKTQILCPSYRGSHFKELVEHGKFLIDKKIMLHVFDPEIYRDAEKICFCSRCKNGFKEFLKKNYPKISYIDPMVFEKKSDIYPDLHTSWLDYKSSLYAGIFAEYREEIEKHIKTTNINQPFLMEVYSTYHKDIPSFYGYKDYRQSPIYIKTMEDPVKLGRYFEYIAPMIYIDIYANFGDYDMLLPWKDISSLHANVGEKVKIVPILSAGFPFCAYDSDISAEMIKWQILETVASGAKGFGFWGCCPIDALDMKYIAESIEILLPVEDIIFEGTPISEVKLTDINGNTFVKGVESGKGAVILISEYSFQPKEAKIKYNVKEDVKVIDLSTFKQVGELTPLEPVFTVTLDKERAKLFFIGKTLGSPKKKNY